MAGNNNPRLTNYWCGFCGKTVKPKEVKKLESDRRQSPRCPDCHHQLRPPTAEMLVVEN